MDSYAHYDAYTAYSSDASSGPRTPSPRSSLLAASPASYSMKLDVEQSMPLKPVIVDSMHAQDDYQQQGIAPFAAWSQPPQQHYAPHHQGSLLGELYEHELPQAEPQYMAEPYPMPQRAQLTQPDMNAVRRATYPYIRSERDDLVQYSQQPFYQHDNYRQPQHRASLPGMAHSMGPYDLDPRVKMEDPMSVMVPSQMMYRSHSMDHMHHMPMPVHPPHPVQLTDDAASKETQYLRRRCTNCSQTEPPSWRRSTLNPGKIVCNKCGLYERTHLRPRPLRFDELRNGNKARKAAKKGGIVKAEAVEASMPSIVRRASMSSQNSSDWDDSLSVGSSGSSMPSSSYSSPAPSSFALPADRTSLSPNMAEGGIRLPNVDMSGLALHESPQLGGDFTLSQPEYYSSPAASLSMPGSPGLLTSSPAPMGSPQLAPRPDIPEVTGWQTVSTDIPSPGRHGPSLLRKSVMTV